MLQIKKKASLISSKYNLRILFRKKTLTRDYCIKKTIGQSIILRSPKHFNIGKQKITNLNFRAVRLINTKTVPFYLNSLLNSPNILYNILRKRIKTTPVLLVSSVRCTIRAKFTLMWLEILS